MSSSSGHNPPSPGSAIENAGKVNPVATRIFYAGYLILAMAAAVVSWKVAPSSLIEVVIILVAVSVVASLLTGVLARQKLLAAHVLLWAILAALVVLLGTFVSAVTFGWPEPAKIIVARVLGQEMLAAGVVKDNIEVIRDNNASFPPLAFEPLATNGDRFDRAAELSKRPSVTLSGVVMHVNAPELHFNVLRLDNSNLVFDLPEAEIEAVRIESVGNSLLQSASAAASAGNGPGAAGGRLKLVVYDRISGPLTVDLRGGPGGQGSHGGAGVNGANGGPGENSAQSLFDCRHGGGPGGPGLPGGKGGDGGQGYSGGDGGTLTIVAPNPSDAIRAITFKNQGGSGGKGGDPGPGGLGGQGGPGGHGGGYCGGGQAGPRGPNGPGGDVGPNGNPGADGKLSFRNLAVDTAP